MTLRPLTPQPCGFNGNSAPTCQAPKAFALAKPMHASHWCLHRSTSGNALCETHARQLLKKWNSR
jgi:hypothetical protein